MTAAEVAAEARGLLRHRVHVAGNAGTTGAAGGDAAVPAGTWPRAVALLSRQALEQALDDLWAAEAPMVRGLPRHPQLLCLGAYVRADEVVRGVRAAWHGLSRACHHHVYELPPTAEELARWLDAVEALVRYDPVAQPRGPQAGSE